MNLNNTLILFFALTFLAGGSREHLDSREVAELLQQAKLAVADQDLYGAKEILRKILVHEPDNLKAQELMASVIDMEIASQIDSRETKVIAEYSDQERRDAIKTWLERARGYMELKQYDEAALAAEKVFLYEPNHYQASELIDQIKGKALEMGKSESLVMKNEYQTEIHQRVAIYLQQAEFWMMEKRYGAARLAIEKSLLLQPENRKALELYDQLKPQRK